MVVGHHFTAPLSNDEEWQAV